jgi:two-component system, LytTR family, sensor kinase
LPDGNKKEAFDLFEFFVKNFLYVVVFHLSIAGAVYFNLKFLLVHYLNRSQFLKYLGSIIALLFGTAILNYSIYNYFIDKLFPSLYYISYFKIWELVMIVKVYLVTSILVFLFVQYFEMLIAKRDAARNELSALKAQINPHFLFNNLNTIYSMASQNDRRTTDVILKLSDFLRYVLYDTSSEKIPLEKEVEMIKTYVGLQKERINPQITKIELDTSGDFSGVEIAPLLLLPLAENCFKHGVGKDLGNIHIFIEYSNQQLVFRTENNVAHREKTDSKENGIGIQNVEKRLSLIYPDRHSLHYQEKDGIFGLEMKVDLKN